MTILINSLKPKRIKNWNSLDFLIFLDLKFSKTIPLNSFALTMLMRSFNSSSISICSLWSRRSTKRKMFNGTKFHLWITKIALISLRTSRLLPCSNSLMKNACSMELKMVCSRSTTTCSRETGNLKDPIGSKPLPSLCSTMLEMLSTRWLTF